MFRAGGAQHQVEPGPCIPVLKITPTVQEPESQGREMDTLGESNLPEKGAVSYFKRMMSFLDVQNTGEVFLPAKISRGWYPSGFC